MPRRAYILVSEDDDVVCQVVSRNGRQRLATYAEAERSQVDLRSRYGHDHQYTIYAIVPMTARVMLEPLETTPTLDTGVINAPPPSPELLRRMQEEVRLNSGGARSTPSSRPTRPRPESAPEDIGRQP